MNVGVQTLAIKVRLDTDSRMSNSDSTTSPDQAPTGADQRPASPPALPAKPVEIGGREGPDPTRYGDWEKNGRCIDF